MMDANYDTRTGQPLKQQRGGGGHTVLKVMAGVFLAGILLAGGCALLVGGAANEAAKSITQSENHFNASASAFRVKFHQVKVGDSLSGRGGMTISQVRMLLGKPDAGDISVTVSGGYKLVTYDYHFFEATGSPSWIVSFTNGRVTDKSAL